MNRFALALALALAALWVPTPLAAQHSGSHGGHHGHSGGGHGGGSHSWGSPRGHRHNFELGIAVMFGQGKNTLERVADPAEGSYGGRLPQTMEVPTSNVGLKFIGRGRLAWLFWGTGIRAYQMKWTLPSMQGYGPDGLPVGGEYAPTMQGTYVQFPFEFGFDPYFGRDEFFGIRVYGGVNINLMMTHKTNLFTVSNIDALGNPNANVSGIRTVSNMSNVEEYEVGWHAGFGIDLGRLAIDIMHMRSMQPMETTQGRRNMGFTGMDYYSWNLSIGFLLLE
jgi:hypothetical protein